MKPLFGAVLTVLTLSLSSTLAIATPALEVLGKDFTFPHQLNGLPNKLSDLKKLQINQFKTSDGVTLRYWELGSGTPLIFIPGWSANGAEYINVMSILAEHYRVIVLDQRNQGLSDKTAYGNRIARYAMDLKELNDHLGVTSAYYCGWSMGASVLWSYIDLFGSKTIRKAVFVDEPVAIVARANWSELERRNAGALAPSADALIHGLQQPLPKELDPQTTNFIIRSRLRDSPYFDNSEQFADSVIKNDPAAMLQVMYDHASNDWSDVIRHKIDIPVAIFTGEYSANVASQRWMHSVIPDSRLFIYSKKQQGDHFLMFKNPFKFTDDLRGFLEK